MAKKLKSPEDVKLPESIKKLCLIKALGQFFTGIENENGDMIGQYEAIKNQGNEYASVANFGEMWDKFEDELATNIIEYVETAQFAQEEFAKTIIFEYAKQ
jgi:hypothetical protein